MYCTTSRGEREINCQIVKWVSSWRTQLVSSDVELHLHRLQVRSELRALGRVFAEEGGELCGQLQRQTQREALALGLLRAEALERQRGAQRILVVLERHARSSVQVGHERLLLEELARVCEHPQRAYAV